MSLYQEWLYAKNEERLAVERRRSIEDKLAEELGIDSTQDLSRVIKTDGYKVRVSCRLNRKIDADLLQEVAAENGLTPLLSNLFRWKPEIIKRAWDHASAEETKILEKAITTTAGRPSFAIEEDK